MYFPHKKGHAQGHDLNFCKNSHFAQDTIRVIISLFSERIMTEYSFGCTTITRNLMFNYSR